MRRAEIHMQGRLAGVLEERERDYAFTYDATYLADTKAMAISLSLPLQAASFEDKRLFPFFDGLIPEGWLLDIAEHTWKLDPRDRMTWSRRPCCCRKIPRRPP